MKRSNALNKKATVVDSSASTKRLYQLRNTSINLKKSSNTNKLLASRGAKVAISTKNSIQSQKQNAVDDDHAKFKATNPTTRLVRNSTRSMTRSLAAKNNSNGTIEQPKPNFTPKSKQNGKVTRPRNNVPISPAYQSSDDTQPYALNNNSGKLNDNDNDDDDGGRGTRNRQQNRATSKSLNNKNSSDNHGVGVGNKDHSKSVRSIAKAQRCNSSNDNKHVNNNNNNNNNKNINSENSNIDNICNDSTVSLVRLNENQNDEVESVQSDTQENQSKKPKSKRSRTKRKYLCPFEFCKKEFLGGNDLRKHIRIHTDERPFECNHCGQKFRQVIADYQKFWYQIRNLNLFLTLSGRLFEKPHRKPTWNERNIHMLLLQQNFPD